MNSIHDYMFCIPVNQLMGADSMSYRKRVGEEIRTQWVLSLPSGRKNRVFRPVRPPVRPPFLAPPGKENVTPIFIHWNENSSRWNNE